MQVKIHSNSGSNGNSRQVNGHAKVSFLQTADGSVSIEIKAEEFELKGDGSRGGREENIRWTTRNATISLDETELIILLEKLKENNLPDLDYKSSLELSEKLIKHALTKGPQE